MRATRTVNRVQPAGNPRDYKTYQAIAPIRTHWRPASCEEFGCLAHRNGWRVHVQKVTAEQLHAAKTSGRKYTVLDVAPGQTYLVFEAGQPCFRAHEHRVPLEKPAIYAVRHGDYRYKQGARRTFKTAEEWRDNFAEHQDKLVTQRNRG